MMPQIPVFANFNSFNKLKIRITISSIASNELITSNGGNCNANFEFIKWTKIYTKFNPAVSRKCLQMTPQLRGTINSLSFVPPILLDLCVRGSWWKATQPSACPRLKAPTPRGEHHVYSGDLFPICLANRSEINLCDPLTISTIIEESPCERSARSVRARGAEEWPERGGVHVDTKAVYTCCRGRGLGKWLRIQNQAHDSQHYQD